MKGSLFMYPADLGEWKNLYPPSDNEGHPADGWCGDAVAAFWQFGQDFHDYFEGADGIITKGSFDRQKTTAERLRARVANVLEDYWTPLGQVAVQRQVRHYRDLLNRGTDAAKPYLEKLRLPGALIYFDKITSIRYHPYTSLPFVGIPYALAAAGDWMGIPHELGHYVYWNLGETLSESSQQQLALQAGAIEAMQAVLAPTGGVTEAAEETEVYEKAASSAMQTQQRAVPNTPGESPLEALSLQQRKELIAMLVSWVEEMFADVVGTWLAGDEFVESINHLTARSAGVPEDLFANDGHHPPLYMRSFVRAETSQWFAIIRDQGGSCDDFRTASLQPNIRLLESYQTFLRHIFADVSADQLNTLGIRSTLLDKPGEIRDIGEALKLDHLALFTVDQVQTAMRPLVEYLVKYLYCEIILQPDSVVSRAKSSSAAPFAQLLKSAEEDPQEGTRYYQDRAGLKAYEVLLRPHILEGGEDHTHSVWGWHDWQFIYHGEMTHARF